MPKAKITSTTLIRLTSVVLLALACGCRFLGEVERDCFDAVSGVRMTLDARPDMFPAHWYGAPHYVRASALPAAEIARSRRLIERALAKYPRDVLDGALTRVYVVGSLEFTGVSAAGTYSDTSLYIVDGGIAKGYTDRYVEETFHHELSSVLWRRHGEAFSRFEWYRQNPPGFHYGGSGVQAIRTHHDSQTLDPQAHVDGFLHEYAKASLEEDFNSVAEALFMNRPELWRACRRYPRLAGKVALAIRFYQSLDRRLDETYFRSLE